MRPSSLNREPRTLATRSRGFSLIEMLATVAALVILLGLMVSLARYVRRQASDQLTKQLLAQLDVLVRNYQTRYHALPVVKPFVSGIQMGGEEAAISATTRPATTRAILPISPAPLLPTAFAEEVLPDEATLRAAAEANNRSFVQALQVEARRYPGEYAGLPTSFFVEGILPDAWGTPIVFMPALHPAIGMAMENRPFTLSAGPDRRFRTLEDNLFSYEVSEEQAPAVPAVPAVPLRH
jgi:prepilin-type N-terminal cleavage/methylation domain-containing protein